MSQSNYNIPNQSAPAVRAQLNSVFGSVATNNSGSAAPATTFAYQWWYDTTTNTLKMRNAANSGWISIGTFDQGSGTFSPSGVVMPDIASEADALAGTDNTKMMTPLRDRQALEALAEGAAGAPRVQGVALSNRVFWTSGAAPVGFIGLAGVRIFRLVFASTSTSIYTDWQVRFTNNGGATWGSYQNISYDSPLRSAELFVNRETGAAIVICYADDSRDFALTVPANCDGVQVRPGSNSTQTWAVLTIEEGVV